MRFLTLSALLAAAQLALASNVLEATSKTFAATLGDTPSLVELYVAVQHSLRLCLLFTPSVLPSSYATWWYVYMPPVTSVFLNKRRIINTIIYLPMCQQWPLQGMNALRDILLE